METHLDPIPDVNLLPAKELCQPDLLVLPERASHGLFMYRFMRIYEDDLYI